MLVPKKKLKKSQHSAEKCKHLDTSVNTRSQRVRSETSAFASERREEVSSLEGNSGALKAGVAD